MKVTGRVTINVSGLGKLDSLPGAKLNHGGFQNEPVEGDHSVGFKQSRKAATVECEILATGSAPIGTLKEIVDATLVFQTDAGHRFAIRNAFVTNGHELTTGGDGKIPLKFAGEPAVPA